MKLRISAILLLLVLLVSFCACGDTTPKETTPETNDVTAEESGDETGEEKVLPNLPALDFEGVDFNIVTDTIELFGGDWSEWGSRDIGCVEQYGDPINDAVYERNLYVEETYKVKINQIAEADPAKVIGNAYMSGETPYDLVELRFLYYPALARGGMLTDINTLPHVDLTAPWYDQASAEGLAIDGRLFAVAGDLIILDEEAEGAVLFNKQLIRDFEMTSPYDLVANRAWTIDKMREMSEQAADDLDGDGAMNRDVDRYGLLCQKDTVPAFFHSNGGLIAKKNADGGLDLTFESDRNYAVLDKIFDLMYNEEAALNLHHLDDLIAANEDIYAEGHRIFSEDRSLFLWVRCRSIESLRGMDTDFGILPNPMYDDTQEQYYNEINKYTGCAIAVPKCMSSAEMTGAILEALSAESRYTLREAYYERNLKGKGARDEESRAMLDIVFGERVYDLGYFFDVGGLTSILIDASATNDREVASKYAAKEEAALGDIEKLYEDYGEYED